MSAPVSLTVTPGLPALSSTSRVGHTELNALGNPTVELEPTGALGADFLNLPEVAEAVGDATTRNFLRRPDFAYEDWFVTPLEVTAGSTGTASAEWYARPVGGPVTVARATDAPTGGKSTWCAEVTGGASLTSLFFYSWLPAAIGGAFRAGTVTFSVWVKKQTVDPITVNLRQEIALNTGDRTTLTESLEADPVTLTTNDWTRLTFTVDATAVDLSKGSAWGLYTEELPNGEAIRIGQAQIEPTAAATPFTRPNALPPSLANLPPLKDGERTQSAQILVQLGNGELRRLGPPPNNFISAYLGWNRALGLPEWMSNNDDFLTFQYTGFDQALVVPSGLGITHMEVWGWGAGACLTFDRPGGVGGFSYGKFPVTGGDTFSVMVGAGGDFSLPLNFNSYGFAGSGAAGGLTGLFSGAGTILVTDTSRAVLVAGGGGCSAYVLAGPSATGGGNGNDPGSSGGESTMKGAIDGTGSTPGGGGYAGGGYISLAGKGGTGYVHVTDVGGGSDPRPQVVSGTYGLEYTARSTPVSAGQRLIVPGSTNPNYLNQAGQTGANGLLVVKWLIEV